MWSWRATTQSSKAVAARASALAGSSRGPSLEAREAFKSESDP